MTAIEPATGRSRRQRMLAPALCLGALTAATAALHVRDPHVDGSWGVCPSAALLGVWCPGCGGLRAVNDLTHLDLAAAASSNLAFVLALPFLLVGFAVWTLDRWRGHTRRPRPARVEPLACAAIVLLAVFTLVRNLPQGSWLAP